MAASAPTDAHNTFELETGEQRAGQSGNSRGCSIFFAFVLGMMVATAGLLTVQHYGLGDTRFAKFLIARPMPQVQPVSGVVDTSVRAQVSNKKALDSLQMTAPPPAQLVRTGPAAATSPLIPLQRSVSPRMKITDEAEQWITENMGPITAKRNMGGGSGWASLMRYAVEGKDTEFVVKSSGSRNLESMFLGEALGLQALGASGSMTVPEVFAFNDGFNGGSYLIMEYMEMAGRADQETFGRLMAQMHLAEPAAPEAKEGRFGFNVDNTIGATPQPNAWTTGTGTDAWIEFFREKRIGFQVRRAGDDQIQKQWEATLKATNGLADLFKGIEVKPSVLHGDLWSGNIAAVKGKPCIFDPATYYGHHEAEWGMSWCASLGSAFWKGYRSVIPKDDGFERRFALYTAYHMLNHYNLFGGGYRDDAILRLAEVERR